MITFGPVHPPTCSLTKLLPKNCFVTPSSNSLWIRSEQKLQCVYLLWCGLCFPEYNTFSPRRHSRSPRCSRESGCSTLQLQGHAKWWYVAKPSWFLLSVWRLRHGPGGNLWSLMLYIVCAGLIAWVFISTSQKKAAYKGRNPQGSNT